METLVHWSAKYPGSDIIARGEHVVYVELKRKDGGVLLKFPINNAYISEVIVIGTPNNPTLDPTTEPEATGACTDDCPEDCHYED